MPHLAASRRVGLAADAAYSADSRVRSGMGADSADVNEDGWMDLFVTNIDQGRVRERGPAGRELTSFDWPFWFRLAVAHLVCSFREFRADVGCDFHRIDLVSRGGARKVGVLRERLTRIESGTIQVGHQSANDNESLEVWCTHFASGFPGDSLVIDGHPAPSRLGPFLLPTAHTAEAAMIVVAKPAEIVEGGHFMVGPGERPRQLFAGGVEDVDTRLFFHALGEKFFRPRCLLLRGS
jgi:hypothetical protein